MNTKTNITEGVIWKQLLSFFFPIFFGTFFQQLYNTTDAVIVGNFVGKEALAAVGGTTGTLINLLVGFFVGLSCGATVIISQYYGAGNREGTQKGVHTAIALCFAGGAVLLIVGLTLAPVALKAMETPDNVMGYALTYMRIYFCGIFFNLLYNIGGGILRAIGDSKTPLIILIACTGTNIVLDLLFVVVFKLEVLGVALATVLSQAVSASLIVAKLMRTDDMYKLDPKKIRFDMPTLVGTIKIGIPAGLQSVLYSVSNIIIQRSINAYGTDTMAAWTAYGKIDGLFWMTMGAFGVSVLTFSGQNFGAHKIDRIKKSVRVSLLMAFGTSVVLSVALMLFGKYILRIFNDDPAVIEKGVEIMKCLVPFYFTYVCIEIISGAVKGVGDAIIPTVITAVGICVLRVVWIYAVAPHYADVRAIAVSYPITWAVTSVMFIIYYLHGGWLKRHLKDKTV